MEMVDYIRHLREDGDAFVRTCELVGPGVIVPNCPGWAVSDLVVHTGSVFRWASNIVESRAAVRLERDESAPAAWAERISWVRACLDRLVDVLTSMDPRSPAWNWTEGPQHATFWRRRMAIEAAVHRCDAEQADGRVTPIDPDLSIDGINEAFEVQVPRRLRPEARIGGIMHWLARDRPSEWEIEIRGGQLQIGPLRSQPTVAVHAKASDLLLLLYNRKNSLSQPEFEVQGDHALLDEWRNEVRI